MLRFPTVTKEIRSPGIVIQDQGKNFLHGVYYKGTTEEPWKNRIKGAMELICSCQNYQLYCVENKSPNLYHLSMNSGWSIILKQKDVCYSETILAEMGPSSWRLQQTATVHHCPASFHRPSPLTPLPMEPNSLFTFLCQVAYFLLGKLLTSLLTGSSYFS